MLLASKTGWSEHHIRWDLPLSRAMAYYHSAQVMEGAKTQWPGENERTDEHAASLREWARSAARQ